MRLLFGGDVVIRGRAESVLRAGQSNALSEFFEVASNHDLTIVNLEAPLTKSRDAMVKTGPALKMPLQAASWLKEAGVGLVTLANNHIFDFGEVGLKNTLDALAESGLGCVGAGMNRGEIHAPFYFRIADLNLAVLNFAENEWSTSHGDSPGATPLCPIQNFKAISAARKVSDFVVVVVHGGHENYPLPTPRMKELYRFFVDAGANLVINHHQHCVSGFEVYAGSPIFYGIGNLFFENPQKGNDDWTKGILLSVTILSDRSPEIEVIHFDQCADRPCISICGPNESESRDRAMAALSEIIAHDEELDSSFDAFFARKAREYSAYLQPFRSRYYLALMNRGILPNLVSRRKKLLLRNLVRCESHREMLLKLLSK